MISPRLKKVAVYTLISISVIVLLSAILIAFYGEKGLWKMILPGDEELIGDQGVPKAGTAEMIHQDFNYLRDQILNRTPYAAVVIDTALFFREADSLIGRSGPEGSPDIGKLFKLASLPMVKSIGAGHTKIPLIQRPLNWKFYPFYAYRFDDGWWIVTAGEDYAELEGARILNVNQVPIEDLFSRAAPYIAADNAMQKIGEFSSYLSYAGFLHQLGLVSDEGVLELTVSRSGQGRETVRVESASLFSLAGLQWGQKMNRQVNTWSPADPRPRSQNYRFEYLEEEQAIYFQFNRVQNQDGQSIQEFTERLSDFVNYNPVARFIVDIRSNGGGNNQLIEPLIAFISGHPKVDRKGVLYTLIGRRTYSAAGAFAMAMEFRTKTLFVGEKSGFSPNHLGDAVKIALPNSRILVSISSRYWQDGGPYDDRDGITPDLEVAMNYEHHKNDNDPALDAALSYEGSRLPGSELSQTEISDLQNSLIENYEFDPLRTLKIRKDPEGFLRFRITYFNDWAYSGIYLLSSGANRFGTDIKDVFLESDQNGRLIVDWKGVRKRLRPMEAEEKNAAEQLIALSPDTSTSVAHVSQLFRDLKNQGMIFDSRLEFQLNKTGYQLLNNNRPEEAVSIFELQTELFPTVANGFDSLGEGYLAVSETEKAREAFETALSLDPGFSHAKKMLENIED